MNYLLTKSEMLSLCIQLSENAFPQKKSMPFILDITLFATYSRHVQHT